jgi:hypothetical protein
MTEQPDGSGPPAEPPWDYPGLFLAERARLRELLAGFGPADWDRPSPCPGWTVLGLCSHLVGDDLGILARHRDGHHARELSEYWIHRQQLLQAVGRPGDLRADLARPVLDALRWAYPFRLGQAAAQPGDTVTISIAGPVTVTWHLVATPVGWEYRDGPGPRAVASLEMTTEQAWRLLTNNLPAADRSSIAASGDDTVLGILLRTRAIIGAPN